ncbi:MAG: hypothetical protein Q9182_000983 [Xanthomendoza sp. 2 TL-2023]
MSLHLVSYEGPGLQKGVQPPRRFYRIVCSQSYVQYTPGTGFVASAHTTKDLSDCINPQMINAHLGSVADALTPFVSVSASKRSMTNFALKLRDLGYTDIKLYYISTNGLFANTLQVSYDYVTVYVPVLQSHDCTFVSVADLRSILCVDLHRQHKSEWLALDRLPGRLVGQYFILPPNPVLFLNHLSQPSTVGSSQPSVAGSSQPLVAGSSQPSIAGPSQPSTASNVTSPSQSQSSPVQTLSLPNQVQAAPNQPQPSLNPNQPAPNQAHPPIQWAQLIQILGPMAQDIFGPNVQTIQPNSVIDWAALVHMLGPVALQILGPNAQAIDPQAYPLGPTHAAGNVALAMMLLQPLFPSGGPSTNGNPGSET